MHPFHRFAQLPDLRRFGHLRLLLFWPLFSLTFYALEHLRPPVYYHPMRCALDAMIPFCRWARFFPVRAMREENSAIWISPSCVSFGIYFPPSVLHVEAGLEASSP